MVPLGPPARGGALWAYSGTHVTLYDEQFKRVIHQPVGADANLADVNFREGSDGWLYGFFGSNSVLQRWRVTKTGITKETLITGITDAAPFGMIGTPQGYGDKTAAMLVGPDGAVYVLRGRGSVHREIFRGLARYAKVVFSGGVWSLQDPAAAYHPLAWDDWENLFTNDASQVYLYATKSGDDFRVRRNVLPAIAGDGRWIAADPIPAFAAFFGATADPDDSPPGPEELEWEWTAAPNHTPTTNPYGVYTSPTARMWGDAWWQRAAYDAAWAAIANGGLSSQAISVTVERIGGGAPHVRESGGSSSAQKATRAARGTAVLPHILVDRTFWYDSTGTVKPTNTNVVEQQGLRLEADAQFVYLLGDEDSFALAGKRLHLYRAALPGVGAAPTAWTQIAALPDFHGTPPTSLDAFAVSRTRLWTVEIRASTPAVRSVRSYGKDGELLATFTDEPPASGAGRSLCLTAAFAARWR